MRTRRTGSTRGLRQGFTLIELLVVIVIIGLLAGAAIPNFWNTTGAATESTLQTDVTNARPALESYYARNNFTYAGATLANTKITKSGSNEIVLSNLTTASYTIQAYNTAIARQCTYTGGLTETKLTCSAYP